MNGQPDLKLLNTFMGVVAHTSMSGAARALGYVPSAVSQQISALESALHAKLFSRRPGSRMTLTPAGRTLADGASRLLAAAADFQDVAQRIAGKEIFQLRIGAYGTAACHLLPPTLARMRAKSENTGLLLQELETLVGLPMVRSGEIDVLIAHRYLAGDPPSANDELEITEIGAEPMLLVVPQRRGQPPLTLSDCHELDWVAGAHPAADRRLLEHWAAERGFAPRVRLETPDCHTAMACIAHSHAVGFIPATAVTGWPVTGDAVRVIDLPDPLQPRREVMVVTRPRYRHPLVDEFSAELAACLERLCDRSKEGAD